MQKIMAAALSGALLIAAASAAHSAPPEPGTEDYEIMHPFADWVKRQNNGNGGWCCDLGDGRPVVTRARDGHLEAFVSKAKFGFKAPDDWMVIPDAAYVIDKGTGQRAANPVGVPILWLNPYTGVVQCFVDASGG